MSPARRKTEPSNTRKGRPASTPKEREDQLINLAVEVAEEQMRRGTASSQVITHYLKLGSSRERLEQERLALEKELLSARVEVLASTKRVEELYQNALDSMRRYSGQDVDDYYDED